MFERPQELPLGILVAVPVALLIILTAVFIRAMERAKQKHGMRLVKKTDINRNVVALREPLHSNKESTNQVLTHLVIKTRCFCERKSTFLQCCLR